eukprot:CAMPEP_0179324314 /NCGR_PEP_ID=MMETSP0797-20121207/60215_1 /TAXON_ID=47934 /ORGANISM="Dinophysis acuminata, Strain DAEP01" /LENGTH=47 /DNA_ID= /DNA_START= /DNA_END= /DNA_ORIENTATION=
MALQLREALAAASPAAAGHAVGAPRHAEAALHDLVHDVLLHAELLRP